MAEKIDYQALFDSGKWLIRFSDNGKAHQGFQWQPKGQWTVAPDWNPQPICGGGLHGQNDKGHGFCLISGRRIDLCRTGEIPVVIDNNKVKACSAQIIAINEQIPTIFTDAVGLKFKDSIVKLSNLTTVDGDLTIKSNVRLPALATVGGYLSIGSNVRASWY